MSTNQLYEAYHLSGPTPALILPSILLNFVSISGILLNSSVIFVTLKDNSLREISNFLLALICLYEIMHQSGHFLFLFVSLSGLNFIPFMTALHFLFQTIIGVNASFFAITLAAADRLFAILAPNFRKRIKKWIYLAICFTLSTGYGFYNAKMFYEYGQANPEIPVTGYLSEVFTPNAIWFEYTTALNLMAIFFYFLIWIAIRRKQGVTQNTNSRLLKSLLLIVLVNICGYLFNIGLVEFVYLLTINSGNQILAWHLSFVNAILLNAGAGSNAIILYFSSSDYKKAYNKLTASKASIKPVNIEIIASTNHHFHHFQHL